MKLKPSHISFSIILYAIVSVWGFNSFSQQPKTISGDSLISLNNYALSLIYTNPDSATYYSNLAYKLAVKQNDSLQIANSLLSLARGNWAAAEYNLSLKTYFDALGKYETLNDTTGILRCYNNIAEVYKKLKNYSNAKIYLYKAKNLHNLFFAERFPVLNYLNLAELFLEEKNYDSASFYLNNAKKAPNNQLTVNYFAAINYNYGILNKDTANYELAITFIEECIRFAKMANNDRRRAEANNILGEILLELNDKKKASIVFNKALLLALKLNHEHLELRIHKNLYNLEFEKGNTINAITHILRYAELRDKIYTTSISRQTAEFEKVYEFEKIEEENSILQLKQSVNDSIIKYQIGFIIISLIALFIAFYFIITINRQRKSLKLALQLLEEKGKLVESQKIELENQSKNTLVLNKELTILNKNLETRAQEIAREMELKNKKMNKYAFMNAHKLRAPIASILGLINLFGKNLGPTDEKLMVNMLKESADKLDNVVHEIKDVIDE